MYLYTFHYNYYPELLSIRTLHQLIRTHVNQRGHLLIYYHTKYGPGPWMRDLGYNIDITSIAIATTKFLVFQKILIFYRVMWMIK